MTVINQDIIPAFQVFDQDKIGFISADGILKSLTSVGEQLNEVEIKAFKDNMKINEEGEFDYNGNVNHSPSLKYFLIVLEFYLKFTEPPKPKRKKKGKKKKKKSK